MYSDRSIVCVCVYVRMFRAAYSGVVWHSVSSGLVKSFLSPVRMRRYTEGNVVTAIYQSFLPSTRRFAANVWRIVAISSQLIAAA